MSKTPSPLTSGPPNSDSPSSSPAANPLRDPGRVKLLLGEIERVLPDALAQVGGERLTLMEVCGTHTQVIFRFGLREVLPEALDLLSGPGCPVCVTGDGFIERARQLAAQPDLTVCTFGDLMRVPGVNGSLDGARMANGADIRMTYSPWDALCMAEVEPDRRFVFLGVGFETTAPLTAATIQAAHNKGVENFFVLSAHKTMPAPMRALAASGEIAVHGFICPGHVSAITGTAIYDFLAKEYHKPCVVAGFEPVDMLQAILMLVRQAAEGHATVENQYERLVRERGNPRARAVMDDVFEPRDDEWRGLGTVPGSGLGIRERYAAHDVERWELPPLPSIHVDEGCMCGDVLRGARRPEDCTLFGESCDPDRPRGPCMVSHEGTCNAHYRYAR